MLSEKANRCIINTMYYEGDVLLTIAIPTYKRFDLLKETLRSVFANDFKINIEVIVVDNDPDNDMLALQEMKEFEKFQFKYYKNSENYGMFGNWNQCLMLAKGKYITLLHDDDLLDQQFSEAVEKEITKGYSAFGFAWNTLDQRKKENKPSFNLVHFCFKKISNILKNTLSKESYGLSDFFTMNRFMGTLGVVFNRDKAIRIAGFDESYYPISDYQFWLKWLMKYEEFKFSSKKVTYYRIRENESMRGEVINLFIKKNDEIRRSLVNAECLSAPTSLINSLWERDKLLFNFNWQNSNNYHKKNMEVLRYLFLRCKCYILALNIKRKIK